jgi:hypothetical protein
MFAELKERQKLATPSQICDHLPTNPTLPFRRSKNGRFLYKMFGSTLRLHRPNQQLFILTTGEHFIRSDTCQVPSSHRLKKLPSTTV